MADEKKWWVVKMKVTDNERKYFRDIAYWNNTPISTLTKDALLAYCKDLEQPPQQ